MHSGPYQISVHFLRVPRPALCPGFELVEPLQQPLRGTNRRERFAELRGVLVDDFEGAAGDEELDGVFEVVGEEARLDGGRHDDHLQYKTDGTATFGTL